MKRSSWLMIFALLGGGCGQGQFFLENADSLAERPGAPATVGGHGGRYGMPSFVGGRLSGPSTDDPQDIALASLARIDGLISGPSDPPRSFLVRSVKKTDQGDTVVTVQQAHQGIPVWGHTQKVLIGGDGALLGISGEFLPDLYGQAELSTGARISADQALQAARQARGPAAQQADALESLGLVIYLDEPRVAHQAYAIRGESADTLVDAASGLVLARMERARRLTGTSVPNSGIGVQGGEKTFLVTRGDADGRFYLEDASRGHGIQVFNADHSYHDGELFMDPDGLWDGSEQADGVDAYQHAQITYDYYLTRFGRNSYDGDGAPIKISVHHADRMWGDNAAVWNGKRILFGDGDGYRYSHYAAAIDVVAHEITHAMTELEAQFVYQNESGALSEAYSDIFATLVEFFSGLDPDWSCAEDIYTPNTPGDALRSLSDPASLGLPDHYAEYQPGADVHKNSTIIGKAAFLLSEGGTHREVTVNGIGQEKLGRIFYRTLIHYATSDMTFAQLRRAAAQTARELYGEASAEATAVEQAFHAVGVD